MATVDEVLNSLKEISCGICQLPGHASSYCWLNGQIHGICRAKGSKFTEANFLWREAIKIYKSVEVEGQKAASKARVL